MSFEIAAKNKNAEDKPLFLKCAFTIKMNSGKIFTRRS